ncbi:MAG: hypothetical protein GF418_10805 [Chitinivibrionales bacterium]|nr:hypothetical protein [Chitinivibrionales bacterium]MBD3396104.1 hypothetical protein [Chitinivibrionales bacterium]
MRHVSIRGCAVAITALALLMVFSGGRPVSAACPADSARYVYLHPSFDTTSWGRAASVTDILLPDTLCDLKPTAFATSRHERYNVAAFISADNELFVMRSDAYTLSCLCCVPTVEFLKPQNVSVPHVSLSSSTPFLVLSEDADSYDTAVVVIKLDATRLEVLAITVPQGTIFGRDTITLSEQVAGQDILAVNAAYDGDAHADTALWVTGTGGMIREVPVGGGAFGAETVHDIGAGVDLTCWADGFAGALDGSIYRMSGGSFSLDGDLGGPVRYVDAAVAAGDAGRVAYRDNGSWTASSAGDADYVRAHAVNLAGGASMELLDASWGYTSHTYADSPTGIAATDPTDLLAYVNGSLYESTGGDIRIDLADPEHNHAAPSIRVLHTDGSQTDLSSDSAYALPDADPSFSCAVGTLLPKDSAITIEVRETSISVRKECLLGTINIACGTCSLVPYAFFARADCEPHDTLVFATASDTLRILNQGNPTRVSSRPAPSRDLFRMVYHRLTGELSILFGRTGAVSVREILLFNARGQRMARVPVSPRARSMRIPSVHAAGVFCVRAVLSDGSVRQRMLPAVR